MKSKIIVTINADLKEEENADNIVRSLYDLLDLWKINVLFWDKRDKVKFTIHGVDNSK